MLHKGSEEMEALDPIQPTGFVTRYGFMAGSLWTTLPAKSILLPLISVYSYFEVRLERDLKQTPTWSKLSDTDSFYAEIRAPVLRWDKCWMSMAKTQKSDVLRLLLVGHIQCIEMRTNSHHQSVALLFKESVSWCFTFFNCFELH